MNSPVDVPVLTEVVTLPELMPAALQERLVQALPELVRQTVLELQPQLEQQLLDALMPRLLASLASTPLAAQSPLTPADDSGLPRLP